MLNENRFLGTFGGHNTRTIITSSDYSVLDLTKFLKPY